MSLPNELYTTEIVVILLDCIITNRMSDYIVAAANEVVFCCCCCCEFDYISHDLERYFGSFMSCISQSVIGTKPWMTSDKSFDFFRSFHLGLRNEFISIQENPSIKKIKRRTRPFLWQSTVVLKCILSAYKWSNENQECKCRRAILW